MTNKDIIFFLKDMECLCEEHGKAVDEASRILSNLKYDLPCKIFDRVFEPTGRKDIPVSEYEVSSFEVTKHGVFYRWELVDGFYSNTNGFYADRIGVDLFLTKEEALAYYEGFGGM